MRSLLDVLSRAAVDFGTQLLMLLGGMALMAALLHLVERQISRRLSHRFGWRSVLVTGWLGVPLHELSHLLFCWIFRHRVVAASLLSPDPRTGTLGYVQHAYRRRNLYQLAGNFFIGIAPLIGGSLVLLAALALLLPGAQPSLSTAAAPQAFSAQLGQIAALAGATLRQIFTLSHVVGWQLWVFLVLALCVGNHMSPSRPDLSGALPGLAVLLGLLFAINLFNQALGLWPPASWVLIAAGTIAPLLAVLCVALVLQVLLWVAIEVLIRLTTPKRGMSLGYESQ